MLNFFPEGNVALAGDDAQRSLSKIVGLLGGASGVFVGSSGSVFSGHYAGGTPTQTPNPGITAAIAYDLDAPFAVWNWSGTAWF